MSDDDFAEPDLPGDLPPAQATPSAAAPRSAAAQAERIRIEKLEADAFWKSVFSNAVGRREMWRLLAQLHPFEERFACGPNGFPQPEASWFHAGEQSFGLRLYQSWAQIDRAGVFLMQDEHDPRFAKPDAPKRSRRAT